MSKTILITGGAGFIGSNLTRRLLDLGHTVICVDSFYSGKKSNIKQFIHHSRFTLIKHDISTPFNYQLDNLDEIYNLACPASPVQYQFDPILTSNIAFNGTQNMLKLARKYGARMLQASTSEVYGDPLEHPQKEEYFGNCDPIGKRSCYDEGKRAGESLCKDYYEQYGLDVRIIRLFNVYGPNMMFNDGRVISNFMLQALNDEDITVHGRGEQSRSFMYVEDLIDAFVQFMDVPQEKTGYGPYNIGNPEERTIKELAHNIKDYTGSKSNIVFMDYETIPERLGDPQQRCADITKISNLIGWRPATSFKDGLRKTYNDFKSRIDDKTNIVVFAPSFHPVTGPAEKLVEEINSRLTVYGLDVVTPKLRKELAKHVVVDGINIHRVGFGMKLDKYLLPIFGTLKAMSLHKKRDYQLAWGIMASYGAVTTVLFSLFTRRAFMISLFEGGEINNKLIKRKILSPIYKLIFLTAHKLQVIAELDQKQIAWLSEKNNIEALDLSKGYDYLTKKTKEDFQILEILSSRL